MNNHYENTYSDRTETSEFNFVNDDHVFFTVGTFAGSIHKAPYRSNGIYVPSDTADQLIFDGLS